MEIRGIKSTKHPVDDKNNGFFELRPPEYFSVPLLADDGEESFRAVNVGEQVKEGSLIAKPNGKYGSFVYSPVSGKVVSVVRKLNASGNMCEHVVILRDLSEEKEYLAPLDAVEIDREILIKRIYESGLVDNFEPYDPAYKKYLMKNSVKELVINCAPFDPYAHSSDALLENYMDEVFEGAKLLQQTAEAEKIVFLFTTVQKKLANKVSQYLSKHSISKLAKVKIYPNIYPLQYDRLIAYYETGKIVQEGTRTAEVGVVVDSVNNCFDFYHAVKEGKPAIERAVTVSGNNCTRKANYFIKNGTPISHILDVVGTVKTDAENMLIYGGILSGMAQESLDVSTTLTVSTILFCDATEFLAEDESPCINCGRCLECCPVRLNVSKLDKSFVNQQFAEAKRLGVTCCIGCGACSYVCPSKRNLTQRIKYMKDYVLGKRAKNPESSEYILVEGEDLRKTDQTFLSELNSSNKFEDVKKTHDMPEVEEMLAYLDSKAKSDKGGDNNG